MKSLRSKKMMNLIRETQARFHSFSTAHAIFGQLDERGRQEIKRVAGHSNTIFIPNVKKIRKG